jgi:glycosyltransferase involved in cell wall biosynthesis
MRVSDRVSDRPALRVAIVIQTPKDPQSAVFISYGSLASALEERGHSVEIVAPSDFGVMRRVGGRWVPLAYPISVARWLRRRRRDFDLVAFHSYAGWLAMKSVRDRPRSMVMFHGLEPLYHQELRTETVAHGQRLSWRYRMLQERLMPFMLKAACRPADIVSCFNKTEAAYLVSRRWTSSARSRVLAHGVPPGFFAPARSARPIRTLLFVGQWLPMKGIGYLRDAAVRLLSESPTLRLVCAGTLCGQDAVLDAFPEAVRSRVTVLPRVGQAELARLYLDADVFVFPSLYEGFSRAIVEAMAARLPIVSTAVGVASDALRDDVNALLVPKRDTAAIVSAVRRLYADPALAIRLGNAARETANEYTLDAVMARTIDVVIDAACGAR